MGDLVKLSGSAGSNTQTNLGGRQAFTLSNGNVLLIVKDDNLASSTNGDKTGVPKLYVYESPDRDTWTLRATITPPSSDSYRITAALHADNSLSIINLNAANTIISYCKMTYSTYAVGAWQTVQTAASNSTFKRLDMAVTDTDIPVVVAYEYASTGTLNYLCVWTRRTSDSTWFQGYRTSRGTHTHSAACAALSVAVVGGTATARATVIVMGRGNASSATGDAGVELITTVVNESTGALTGTATRATYAVGDAIGNSTRTFGREAKLFNTNGTGEYTLGIMHEEGNTSTGNRNFYVHRGVWDGSTWTTSIPLTGAGTTRTVSNLGDRGMGITASNNVINFLYSVANEQTVAKKQYVSYATRINPATKTVRFTPSRGYWDNLNQQNFDNVTIWGGGDRNLSQARHDTIRFMYSASTVSQFYHQYAKVTGSGAITTPAAGATMQDANPALGANADTGLRWKQSQIRMQFQFAKDTLFTTSLVTYLQDDSDYADVNSTDTAGVVVKYTDKLPTAYNLPQGTWYMRAAMYDEYDQISAYSPTITFSISHPPAASGLSPSSGVQIPYGTGQRQFTWKFTDPAGTDFQTAYQIVVERTDTGAVVLDTGKVVSAASSGTQTIAATFKDLALRWKVRVWDRDDVAGAYSSYAFFSMADGPSATITVPATNAVLTSGVPTLTATLSVGGSRIVTSYEVRVTQGTKKIWSITRTNLALGNGAVITETAPKSMLLNLQSYSYQVFLTDNTGLTGQSASLAVTTNWVTPAAPTGLAVDASQYNVDGAGYVNITWADAGRDADFSAWVIYRRDNLIDPATGAIITAGSWNEITRVYDVFTSGYTYRDYLAPSSYQVDYRITQEVNRFGDAVESSNTAFVSAFPASDGYWLITPALGSVAATAFKLASVAGDSYTDEYESEEYTVIGRGRHVDIGQHLGFAGQLDARIRTSGLGTARQKKQRIELIKTQVSVMWLRNPFGDSFPVSIGNVQVSRVAGVGTSEFCDLTIPYSQVGL